MSLTLGWYEALKRSRRVCSPRIGVTEMETMIQVPTVIMWLLQGPAMSSVPGRAGRLGDGCRWLSAFSMSGEKRNYRFQYVCMSRTVTFGTPRQHWVSRGCSVRFRDARQGDVWIYSLYSRRSYSLILDNHIRLVT